MQPRESRKTLTVTDLKEVVSIPHKMSLERGREREKYEAKMDADDVE